MSAPAYQGWTLARFYMPPPPQCANSDLLVLQNAAGARKGIRNQGDRQKQSRHGPENQHTCHRRHKTPRTDPLNAAAGLLPMCA